MTETVTDLFDEIYDLPDPDLKRRYDDLAGLDDVKEQLHKDAALLLDPTALDAWSKKFHGRPLPAVSRFRERPPLILISGDVGTGKTTLAESFGDRLARELKIPIKVHRLGLMTRGRGAVGEMTNLITRAFAEVESQAGRGAGAGKPRSATILIIDEADALAESRAGDQMHHEDRAGVNAVIRGIDRLSDGQLPVLVLMCTNRDGSLDPAIVRRASARFTFGRPGPEQTKYLLRRAFDDVFSSSELDTLTTLIGPGNGRAYGFTYSDLTNRLVPAILLEAFPDRAVTFEVAESVCRRIEPTQPFGDSNESP